MVRVVYIAGDGRSGTTILNQILGSYPGCLAVGELYDIWTECVAGERFCSCGVPLRDCQFWKSVLERTLGSTEPSRIQNFIELRLAVQRPYHVAFLMFPRLRPKSFDRRMNEYVAILERLYTAIQEISGCETIVDSSKLAAYALALNESPLIEVDLVHISRDSRACAYSWRRLKREPVASDKPRYLEQRSLAKSAVVWSVRNFILSSVSHQFATSAKLRYETFVCKPRETMRQLAARLGLGGHEALWYGDNELQISSSSHIFAGNPVRVQQGRIRVRSDDEWRTRMPHSQQRFVFALSLPVLWMLGYLGNHSAHTNAIESERLAGEQAG